MLFLDIHKKYGNTIFSSSLYLFKLGKAPQIQDLYGKIQFTDDEISAMAKELEKYGMIFTDKMQISMSFLMN